MPLKTRVILFLILFLLLLGCKEQSPRLKKALQSFRLEPGLRIELVVSEPLVIDPVAFAFDEDRVMYVVENRGYPDPAEGGAPTKLGRVARLTDTDGDGTYDHRTEFADGFTYPNGVLNWKGGVFVTCSPDIFYLKDTDGDGVADVRQVVLTGFNDNKTAQIRMSHPTLGLDGWVYVSGGLNGGAVSSPLHPNRPAVEFSSADGRFHPETFEFEVTGGRSQFGITFDPYGRRFGCSNRHPIQHIVFEPSQLNRNPDLLFTETIMNVSAVEADAVVYPISGATTTADFIPNLIGRSHRGTFTAASGVLVFNGTGLTPAHRGNAFICESAQNLVQRQVIHSDGVTFHSELPYREREFLASTDEWFRPVFLQTGPEGALYVADMHRKVIDHPSYVPEEARGSLDFDSGKDDGRIYRIVREDFKERDGVLLNSSVSIAALVDALQSPEEWERATAQRLLLERRDPGSIPLLKRCVEKPASPESTVRALWLLGTLDALDEETLKMGLASSHAVVREQAVQLAGVRCANNAGLLEAVAAAAYDSARRVRFVTALALGSLQGDAVIPALARIASVDGGDRWARAAVLSGLHGRVPQFMDAFRKETPADPNAFPAVMRDVGQLVGKGGSRRDSRLLFRDIVRAGEDAEWRISTALGLAEGSAEQTEKNVLAALLGADAGEADRDALNAFINHVQAIALEEDTSSPKRSEAIALLGFADFSRTSQALQQLLDARHPPDIQIAVIRALARQGDVRGGKMLTAKNVWAGYTPRVRSAAIAALVSKPVFVKVLFDAIESGIVPLTDIPSGNRQALMKNKHSDIRERALVLFKDLEEGDRMQVYESYRNIFDQPADAALGKAVFLKNCSTCHSYAGSGGKVGPDLTGVHNQPADALLLHTLVPNYEVYPAYQAISVETRNGRSFSGTLVAETENSLTLRLPFGTDESILRSDLKSLTNTGRSLMPEGLEQNMTREELAQLIAYLKSGQP